MCGVGAKSSAGVWGFGCVVGQEFTVQVGVVLGKWCGCCIGQSLQCRCVWFGVHGMGATVVSLQCWYVWFWVHDMGATVVRVYSAGVCGFG